MGAKAPGYTRDKGIAIMMVHLSPQEQVVVIAKPSPMGKPLI
jgi:hypothetical protein